MAYPSYPPPPQKPPISTADLWVSIGALVVTVIFGGAAAVMGLLSLAFLDYCPPESCSSDGAASAVGIALLAAFAIGVVGLVVTVVQLVRRKPDGRLPLQLSCCAQSRWCWVVSGTPWLSAECVSGKSRPQAGSFRLRFSAWNQTI